MRIGIGGEMDTGERERKRETLPLFLGEGGKESERREREGRV